MKLAWVAFIAITWLIYFFGGFHKLFKYGIRGLRIDETALDTKTNEFQRPKDQTDD
jgi:hypothetical protein